MDKNQLERIVMVGPSSERTGGIRSVVDTLIDSWDFDHYSLVYLPSSREGSLIAKALYTLKGVIRFALHLIRNKPAIAHIHFSWKMSFWRKAIFVILARFAKMKIILHCHASRFDIFFNRAGWLRRKLIKRILISADTVLTVSSSWKVYFENLLPNLPVRVLYNPVVIPEVKPVQRFKQKIILFLGTIEVRKGVFDLIETVPETIMGNPDVVYWIGGDGDRSHAEDMVRDLGVQENVRFLGYIRGEEKEEAFSKATLFCLPSHHEGLPVAILEAMAHGLPIISTRVGGIPEQVIDGENGFLIDSGDVNDLSNKITRLLNDRELQIRMGQRSLSIIEQTFQVEAIIERLYSLYDELLNRNTDLTSTRN
jgi:glycosyltransferase involved in cell wall biosynthesis